MSAFGPSTLRPVAGITSNTIDLQLTQLQPQVVTELRVLCSLTDGDRDVSGTARGVNDSFKRVPVRMGGAAAGTGMALGGGEGAQVRLGALCCMKLAQTASCLG
jgi:hypothetical protein